MSSRRSKDPHIWLGIGKNPVELAGERPLDLPSEESFVENGRGLWVRRGEFEKGQRIRHYSSLRLGTVTVLFTSESRIFKVSLRPFEHLVAGSSRPSQPASCIARRA